MVKLVKPLLFFASLLVSCGPPSPTHDNEEGANDEESLEADCASFCNRAVDCNSEEYAADWGFESRQECVDYCVVFTNGAVAFSEDPACEKITRAVWTCAAILETCEDFRSYEDAAFAKGAVSHPCDTELDAFFQECN